MTLTPLVGCLDQTELRWPFTVTKVFDVEEGCRVILFRHIQITRPSGLFQSSSDYFES